MHRLVVASCRGLLALLILGCAACGDGDGAGGSAVTSEYVIDCARVVGHTCPTEMACALSPEEFMPFTLNVSGQRVTLTDAEGQRGSTQIDADGVVDVTLSDTEQNGGCAIERTREFVLSPADGTVPAQLMFAFRYQGDCGALADCMVDLAGRLQPTGVARPSCQQACTKSPECPCGPDLNIPSP